MQADLDVAAKDATVVLIRRNWNQGMKMNCWRTLTSGKATQDAKALWRLQLEGCG